MAKAADASAGPRHRSPEAAGLSLAPNFACPLLEHSRALTGESPVDLAIAAPNKAIRLGGAFSFMCTLRMVGIGSWSRVFDFSLTADEDSITAGAIGLTNDLHFTVFRGKKPFSAVVSNFFELAKEMTMLCTVSSSGYMRVFKDGALVGENAEGMAPLRMDRPRMIVGGHYLYADQAFNGSLKSVKLWDREVAWSMLEVVKAAEASAGPRHRSQEVAGLSLAPHVAWPLLEHSGTLTGESPLNLAIAAPNKAVRMGGAFSFMCTLKMDSFGCWSRVFDFSLTANEDSITAGAVGFTNDLHFTVFRGNKPFSVVVSNFFELGKEVTMLCTVSPLGHMRVFKDGALAGEKAEGMAPLQKDRPRMIVGGHYLYADQAFNGSLKSVKLWDREVAWSMLENAEASLGPKAPPDGDPDAASRDTDAESWATESWDEKSWDEKSWDSLGLASAGGREDAASVPSETDGAEGGPDPEAKPGGGPLLP